MPLTDKDICDLLNVSCGHVWPNIKFGEFKRDGKSQTFSMDIEVHLCVTVMLDRLRDIMQPQGRQRWEKISKALRTTIVAEVKKNTNNWYKKGVRNDKSD